MKTTTKIIIIVLIIAATVAAYYYFKKKGIVPTGVASSNSSASGTAGQRTAGVTVEATRLTCVKRASSPGHPCIEWKDTKGNTYTT